MAQCRYCRKFAHIAKACIKRKKSTGRGTVHIVDPERMNVSLDQHSSRLSSLHDLIALSSLRRTSETLILKLEVEGVPLWFEVNPVAVFSLTSEETFCTVWPRQSLRAT